jgi:tetratricopeptide (TPR) repeat protein
METLDWPVADRMRRIKVQALFASRMGQDKTALRLAEQALSLAQMAGIERYVLAIQLDIAHVHLKMGTLDAALNLFRLIVGQAIDQHYHRLTVAQAYVGLTTALMQRGDLKEAAQVCLQALPHLRSNGLFLKHGDLFAWGLALAEQTLAAARILGATSGFFARSETARTPITQKIHDTAMQLLTEQAATDQLQLWLDESAEWTHDENRLASYLEQELQRYLMGE